jgi:hypothetical protein
MKTLDYKYGMEGWVLVAHAYNPSYSGSRNQEESGSKPAQANSSPDPVSKNPSQQQQQQKGWRNGSSGRMPA